MPYHQDLQTHAVRAQKKSLNQKKEIQMRKSNAIRLGENEVLEGTREVGAGERADGTLGTPLAVGMHA